MLICDQSWDARPPSVSVILPTYNRATLLPRAMGTVLGQDYRDLELIIVDDGSTDSTSAIVRGIADQRVRYCRLEQRRGAAAARNAGIALARGNLIAFQDSDDEWLPGKLGKQVRAMAEGGGSLGYSYSSFWHQTNGLRERIPSSLQTARHGSTFHRLLHGNFIGTPTLLVTRSCLELAGVFDETMRSLEDWDLVLRLSRVAEGLFVEEPLVLAHDSLSGVNSQRTEVMLASLNAIHRRYATEFRQDRRADAKMYLCMAEVGTQGTGLSNWCACVKHYALACSCDPSDVKTGILLVASLTGLKSMVRLRRLFHRLKSGTVGFL